MPNPGAGYDPSSFFNAIGSGSLASLHTLEIARPYTVVPIVLGDADLLPNSLPALHSLSIDVLMPAGLLGGIFAAAGPNLSSLSITHGQTVSTALRLLEENDYPWLSSLKTLSLLWKGAHGDIDALPVDPDRPVQAIEALTRLPALKSLTLELREPDEIMVRLLVLAEGGGLQSLSKLDLYSHRPGITEGAVLLMLLWLKRETKKALLGEGGVMWDVDGLHDHQIHDSMKQITETHLAQLKEARSRVRAGVI